MYRGENVLHIAIVKRNASMVEWLLSEELLQPYRENLLTAAATGDFFKMYICYLLSFCLHLIFSGESRLTMEKLHLDLLVVLTNGILSKFY
jgi:hypothetical protein